MSPPPPEPVEADVRDTHEQAPAPAQKPPPKAVPRRRPGRGGEVLRALLAYAAGGLIAVVGVLLIRVLRTEPQPMSDVRPHRPAPAPLSFQPALDREQVLPPELRARSREEAARRHAASKGASTKVKAKVAPSSAQPAAATTWAEGAVPDFGELTWPAGTEIVTSEFGPRLDPVGRERRYSHRGLDVRCACGTPVLAALSGRVHKAGVSPNSGNVVRIEHAGKRMTRYAHLSRIDVKEGDRVVAGQRIGLSGATGRVTGPHLHFEIWEAGKPLDPRALRYFFYPAEVFRPHPVSAAACGTMAPLRRDTSQAHAPFYVEGEDFGGGRDQEWLR